VRETEQDVCIQVEHPDPRSLPGTAIPLVGISRRETVVLRAPLRGRRLTVPAGTETWRGARHVRLPSDVAPAIRLIPRVLGLNPEDADRLLRDQEIRPHHTGQGPEIVAQDPEPDMPCGTTLDVTLTVGTSR
jgi:hypothetical protein